MGTYSISQKLDHPSKFACLVSFNGKPAHYHEIDAPVQEAEFGASEDGKGAHVKLSDRVVLAFTPEHIDACLQYAADRDAELAVKVAERSADLEAIKVVDGKIELT